MTWWLYWITGDPVRSCPVYKEQGCTHVDGLLCDFPTCSIIDDFKHKENNVRQTL